jgi:hypothetical protein
MEDDIFKLAVFFYKTDASQIYYAMGGPYCIKITDLLLIM